jgi:ZIP family zinc transporter
VGLTSSFAIFAIPPLNHLCRLAGNLPKSRFFKKMHICGLFQHRATCFISQNNIGRHPNVKPISGFLQGMRPAGISFLHHGRTRVMFFKTVSLHPAANRQALKGKSFMPADPVLFAFGLTLLAGLATGVGSALAFFAKQTNTRFLSVALGFSAGVMIYVSMIEIFFKARASLTEILGETAGYQMTTLAFFAGIVLIAVIDKLVPSFENPHEIRNVEDLEEVAAVAEKNALLRMGMLSAVAIGIHNFPEGLATFTTALRDPTLGVSIAVAIAIHNIPEGIAVSVPVYYATGSKKKAFTLSFLSGLSEPLGALVGYLILLPFFNDLVYGMLFASVAGIMVFISIDELLPSAEKYGEHHLSIYGLIVGMAVMAASLILFA